MRVVNTNFLVFGLTQPGIEPTFTASVPDVLSTDRTTTIVIVDLPNKNHALSQNIVPNQARMDLCHFIFQ